jgi:hypothetical protein
MSTFEIIDSSSKNQTITRSWVRKHRNGSEMQSDNNEKALEQKAEEDETATKVYEEETVADTECCGGGPRGEFRLVRKIETALHMVIGLLPDTEAQN